MIKKFLHNKELIISLIILALLIFTIYALIPFLSAIFGAIILSFIFYPLHLYFTQKIKLSKKLSVSIILIIISLLIIIPSYFLVQGLLNQISAIPEQIKSIGNISEKVNSIIPIKTEINQQKIIDQSIQILGNLATPIFSNIMQFFLLIFLMLFLLYYLLIYHDEIKQKIYNSLPFKEKNKRRIVEKFYLVSYSAILGTFLIAIIQGGLLALNFYLLGIPNALFWGLVTVILSILPIVGAPFVWVPASIILFLSGETAKAIVMFIAGMMISTVDNIIRPIINKQYGSIHPLISVFGVFIGISQFGIIGIFLGPLIIVYLILFWDIYKENYLKKNIFR